MYNSTVITEPADDSARMGLKTCIGTVMTKFVSHVYRVLPFEGLSTKNYIVSFIVFRQHQWVDKKGFGLLLLYSRNSILPSGPINHI